MFNVCSAAWRGGDLNLETDLFMYALLGEGI